MSIDGLDAEVRSLLPPPDFSRRGFLTTTLRLQGWFQKHGAA